MQTRLLVTVMFTLLTIVLVMYGVAAMITVHTYGIHTVMVYSHTLPSFLYFILASISTWTGCWSVVFDVAGETSLRSETTNDN